MKEKKQGLTSNNSLLSNPPQLCLAAACLRSKLYSSNTSQNSPFTHGFLTEVLCVYLNLVLKEGSSHSATSPSRHLIKKHVSLISNQRNWIKKNTAHHLYYHLGKHCFKMKIPKLNKDLTKWAFSHTAGEF